MTTDPDLTARARAAFDAGDLAGAIALAREPAADLAPWAQALRAVTRGDWATGIAAAHHALLDDDGDTLARWCRAEARVGLGDRAGALADWSLILARDPDSRTSWKDRALLRALLGDRAGALADLRALAARSPADVVPHLWIAGLGGQAPELERFAAGSDWSARLAGLVLGRLPPGALRREATAVADPGQQRARACQVEGYAGVLAERAGEAGAARACYRACVETGVWHFLTHLWARERLRELAG